jgi:hypothetical protein
MQPTELNLFYEPKDRLRLTLGDERSFHTVKPVWAAPLSHPKKHLVLLNAKNEEIVLIEDPKTLPPQSYEAVMEELSRRYLTSTVHKITEARTEFGSTYWHVVTERGEREFVTQSLQENAQWLSPTHLLLIDVDGNRFEIEDVDSLDLRSREFVAATL